MRRLVTLTFGMLAMVSLAVPAVAATITGHIGFSGGIAYATLDTSGHAILDFTPLGTEFAGGTSGGSGVGSLITIDGVTNYFAAFNAITNPTGHGAGIPTFSKDGVNAATVTVQDLTNSAAATYGAFAPTGVLGAPLVANFLNTFTSAILPAFYTGLHFDLTEVLVAPGAACTGAETIGQSCSEGPFTIEDTLNGIRVNFDVLGTFVNGADSGKYNGSFAADFNGLHFQSGADGSDGLFKRLDVTGADLMCGTGNATTNCTVTGNFDPVPTVPEPLTLLTFGSGSAFLAAMLRRRRKNQA